MPIYDDDGRRGYPRPLTRNGPMSDVFGPPCDTSDMSTHVVPIIGKVYFHDRVAKALAGVMQDIAAAGLASLVDMDDFGGTYCCRTVRGSTARSPHSWGVAIDLNVTHKLRNGSEVSGGDTNFHCKRSEIAQSLRKLAPFFRRWGFSWGGDWNDAYLDPMHFEATELTVALSEGKPVPDAFLSACGRLGTVSGLPEGIIVQYTTGEVLTRSGRLIDDHLFVPLRELEPALGRLVDHIADQGKVYVARREA